MSVERTTEGLEIRLRSSGPGRYLSAAFLAFWLCGWAVGESVVLWLLLKGGLALVTGTPPEPGRAPLDLAPALMVGLFLLLWLTLWTFGGIAAISELLRLLWGDDRIAVSAGQLTVTWTRGLFRSGRTVERDAIRRVTLAGRHDHLILQTAKDRLELSGLGSRSEREDALRALIAELGLQDAADAAAAAIPPQWEEVITPEGERVLAPNLTTRRTQARVASAFTLFLAALTFLLVREAIGRPGVMIPALILLTLTTALTGGTLWLARGRWEWRIGQGRLTLRKRYGSRVRDVFEAWRLALEISTDSDGDVWYDLVALAEGAPQRTPAAQWGRTRLEHRRSVARVMNDPASVRDLGAWLARAAGVALEDRTTPEARAVELAELRAALETSGRLGQLAAGWLDRLGPGRSR